MVLYPIKTIDMSHLPIIFPTPPKKTKDCNVDFTGLHWEPGVNISLAMCRGGRASRIGGSIFWMGKSEHRKPPIPMNYGKYEKYGCFL